MGCEHAKKAAMKAKRPVIFFQSRSISKEREEKPQCIVQSKDYIPANIDFPKTWMTRLMEHLINCKTYTKYCWEAGWPNDDKIVNTRHAKVIVSSNACFVVYSREHILSIKDSNFLKMANLTNLSCKWVKKLMWKRLYHFHTQYPNSQKLVKSIFLGQNDRLLHVLMSMVNLGCEV